MQKVGTKPVSKFSKSNIAIQTQFYVRMSSTKWVSFMDMLDDSCIDCGVALSISGCEIPTPETLEGLIAKGTGNN